MKKPYSDYAAHCIRYYLAHPDGDFRDGVDKANWYSVHEALKAFNNDEVNIIAFIYRQRDCSMQEAVDRAMYASDMKRNRVWTIISKLESEIASKRGL